ncbi:hypothetical protein MHN79_17735 [Vibrio sp. Of14-4]|uniref:hypothetical protein n=1 Tax=Vibrio sp. Of14-4 TaxID=2724878 RepID=UPI001EF3D51E|nr:hypothetical protein [Vibrio sp. Of14-4]MCG7491332.1 hypothetical protein [Vibrio sp. Of14-4]
MRNDNYKKNLILLAMMGAFVSGVTGCSDDDEDKQALEFSSDVEMPISGLAAGDAAENGERYDYSTLAVFDWKNYGDQTPKPRFGVVERHGYSATVVPLDQSIVNWPDEARGNDLEAICQIDDTYYLAAESGYYHDKEADTYQYGRLFLVERDPTQGGLYSGLSLAATYQLTYDGNQSAYEDKSFEGLACAPSDSDDGSYNILLGDRESGDLYWDKINPMDDITSNKAQVLDLQPAGRIQASVDWGTNRNISELFYSSSGHLYGVASFDPDDSPESPRATMYKSTDTFSLENDAFMQALTGLANIDVEAVHTFPNHKIEGITAYGTTGGMFYGSDDDTSANEYGLVKVQ